MHVPIEAETGRGWSREQPRPPTRVAGSQELEASPLPPKAYVSRKLESGDGARHADVGCGHLIYYAKHRTLNLTTAKIKISDS